MRSRPVSVVPGLSRTSYPALALIAVFLIAGLARLRDGDLAGFLVVPALGAAIEWAYRKQAQSRHRGAGPTLDGITWTVAACLTGCAVFSALVGAWMPVVLAAAALGVRYMLERQPAGPGPAPKEGPAPPP